MFWSGWVKDCEGGESGRGWTGDGGAAICVALVKGATRISLSYANAYHISIHTPVKGATVRPLLHRVKEALDFNPRSREGSDDKIVDAHFLKKIFQSTLPRRERRGLVEQSNKCKDISIHAPTKGATLCPRRFARPHDISIHAPAKGATATVSATSLCGSDFNPRSREGSDNIRRYISACSRYFNPRSREGSDNHTTHYLLSLPAFQSMLPRRERLAADTVDLSTVPDFNPRSREGSDEKAPASTYKVQISIHAPAKGATTPRTVPSSQSTFQSTLPRRERLRPELFPHRNQHFNPRSREGSDHGIYRVCGLFPYFNPRSREGSDSGYVLRILHSSGISIHAPVKGAT